MKKFERGNPGWTSSVILVSFPRSPATVVEIVSLNSILFWYDRNSGIVNNLFIIVMIPYRSYHVFACPNLLKIKGTLFLDWMNETSSALNINFHFSNFSHATFQLRTRLGCILFWAAVRQSVATSQTTPSSMFTKPGERREILGCMLCTWVPPTPAVDWITQHSFSAIYGLAVYPTSKMEQWEMMYILWNLASLLALRVELNAIAL